MLGASLVAAHGNAPIWENNLVSDFAFEIWCCFVSLLSVWWGVILFLVPPEVLSSSGLLQQLNPAERMGLRSLRREAARNAQAHGRLGNVSHRKIGFSRNYAKVNLKYFFT